MTNNGMAAVAQVDGPSALGVRWVGEPLPLTSTSAGKLLLASLPDADVDAVLQEPILARTALTLTDPAAVRREIEEIRARGVAASIGDYELGVNGISAPVDDPDGRLVASEA